MKSKPLVSIIIPTRNSTQFLNQCLSLIKNQSYKNIEIIVVDNNSADETKEIAKKYTNFVYNKGPERSAQRNYGSKKTRGNYLLFLDSDMVLDKNVVLACVNKVENNKNIVAINIPEKSFGQGFWAQCKKLERSFYVGVDWMQGARFFNKKAFKMMGGYNESITGTEDFDLPQRIKAKFGNSSITGISKFIYHNEGRLSLLKTLTKKFYYGKTINAYRNTEINIKMLKKQGSIINRYKLFFSQPKKLLKNPFISIGMIIMKSLELLFISLGYFIGKKKL